MKLIQRHMQFIKFGFVAASYNLVAYSIYATLIYFHCNYLIASTISFLLGVMLSYFMNKRIVFAVKHHHYVLIMRYIIFYMLLLGINLILLHGLVSLLKINPYLAQILTTMIAALISYNTMRVFVFKKIE